MSSLSMRMMLPTPGNERVSSTMIVASSTTTFAPTPCDSTVVPLMPRVMMVRCVASSTVAVISSLSMRIVKFPAGNTLVSTTSIVVVTLARVPGSNPKLLTNRLGTSTPE